MNPRRPQLAFPLSQSAPAGRLLFVEETRRYRADWIPAYAGVTWRRGYKGRALHAPSWRLRAAVDSRLRGNDGGYAPLTALTLAGARCYH